MFVRTKDKIIKVDETGYIKEVDVCGKNCLFLFNKNFFYGREVLKQADTIEELCDGFVTVGNKHIVWDKQHCLGLTFEQVKESYSTYHFKIYGAIWTDEGLIYVAKMNDKGELELCPN